MVDRSRSDALKSRARGIMIGSLIAFGWAVYGLSGIASSARPMPGAAAVAVTSVLLYSGAVLVRRARKLPPPESGQKQVNNRAWRWFWVNLAAEIILLNIVFYLIGITGYRAYLIPAISIVVGLHFWPMAVFFRVPSYWLVGALMLIGAGVAVYFIANAPGAPAFAYGEALANAAILWFFLAVGAVAAFLQHPSGEVGAIRP